MPTMRVRFPGGRYHATPWGHHVNEGLIEWPPCPWRLLRALIATGYTKLGWGDTMPDTGRHLIEVLAGTLPSYSLPPASGAHSRHYMPLGILDKEREKTTLVFDTWANIGNGEMVIYWDCELDDDARDLFDQLVRNLSYLGRSESWVEAEPMADAEAATTQFNAYPHIEGHHAGPDWEQVSLLAAEPPDVYGQWQTQRVKQALSAHPLPEGKKKPTKKLLSAREKAAAPYPADLLDCLQKNTVWWKGHKWSQPPGSRRVIYWRQANALQVSPPVQRRQAIVRPITALLLAITTPSGSKSALSLVSRTLPQAELLHAALIRRAAQGNRVRCPELTGKDEQDRPLRNGHSHAHILPLDLDDDQHIDHILVHAPMGLQDVAQRAVRSLRRTWTKGGVGELQLALAGRGDLDDLRRLPDPLKQRINAILPPDPGALRWRSITPFVPARFEKPRGKNNDLVSQVQMELKSRRLPSCEVVVLPTTDGTARRFRHFIRRRGRGESPPRDVGYALELRFDERVPGPVSLGYANHFGLGLFAAEPEQ